MWWPTLIQQNMFQQLSNFSTLLKLIYFTFCFIPYTEQGDLGNVQLHWEGKHCVSYAKFRDEKFIYTNQILKANYPIFHDFPSNFFLFLQNKIAWNLMEWNDFSNICFENRNLAFPLLANYHVFDNDQWGGVAMIPLKWRVAPASTICIHACFLVLCLISAAWYTCRHATTFVLTYMRLAITSACGTARAINESRNRRVSSGQSVQTTTREVSFALLLMDTQWTPECHTTPKWWSVIVQSADIHVLALYKIHIQTLLPFPFTFLIWLISIVPNLSLRWKWCGPWKNRRTD